MTEAEARKKWCPMIRVNGSNAVHFQDIAEHKGMTQRSDACHGRGCMMWRWDTKQHTRKVDQTGYCGLAGIPK